MAKTRTTKEFNLYCTKCGNLGIPIQRRANHFKSGGHLKKLYCLTCKQETNHCEIRPEGPYTLEQFQDEFNLGRFVDGLRIPESQLEICDQITCNYNKNNKCWNSNCSFLCSKRIQNKEENNQ